MDVGSRALPHLGQIAQMRGQRVSDDEGMRQHEDHEDRHPRQHRLLRPAQVQQGQYADPAGFHQELIMQQPGRQHAEQGIRAAGHRNRDRQHVVNQQRAARYHPHPRREQLAGNQVTAAARREQLDDLRIAGADDEYRHDRRRRHDQAQVYVPIQRLEGLFRPVARRGQPVRPEPHPGEKGDERELVEYPLIGNVAGLAD